MSKSLILVTIGLLLVLSCTTENPTGVPQSGSTTPLTAADGDQIGKWIAVKYYRYWREYDQVDITDTVYTLQTAINIIEITADTMANYVNDPYDSLTYVLKEAYMLVDTLLILDDPNGGQDTLNLGLSGDTLILRGEFSDDNYEQQFLYHFIAYTGSIPPAHWPPLVQ